MIAHGYGNAAAIGRFTQRQILLHYACALRREKQQRAATLVDVNMAFAGGKEAEQHLQTLTKE